MSLQPIRVRGYCGVTGWQCRDGRILVGVTLETGQRIEFGVLAMFRIAIKYSMAGPILSGQTAAILFCNPCIASPARLTDCLMSGGLTEN